MQTINEVKKELYNKMLAKKSLKHFMRLKLKRVNGVELIDNWHIDYICESLICSLPQFAAQRGVKQEKRIILNMPPRYGKTEIVKCFIAWALGHFKGHKFIYVCYDANLNARICKELLAILKSPLFVSIFGELKFDTTKEREIKLSEASGGGVVYFTTFEAGMTGSGADTLIIDDPIKVSDMRSEAQKRVVNEGFTATAYTRLQNTSSNIIIIMQRLGVDDLCGYLLDERFFEKETIAQWRHINLKAINSAPEFYEVGGFKYTREANEPLFKAKHDLEELEKIKAILGTDEFAAQYQQDPQVSFAGYFEEGLISEIASYEMGEVSDYIFVDYATSLKAGADNRAVVCVGVENNGRQNRYIFKECLFGVWDESETIENIIELALKYKEAEIYIENAAGGDLLKRLLDKKIVELSEERGLVVNNFIKTYSPSRRVSKIDKIKALRPYLATKSLVFLKNARGAEQVKKELFSFNPAKIRKDDCIDALASCVTADFVRGELKPATYEELQFNSWNL